MNLARWRNAVVAQLGTAAAPCIFVLACATQLAAQPVGAPPQPTAELAEFIVNVVRYASWPKAAAAAPLTICFASGGSDAITGATIDPDRMVKGVAIKWLPISSPHQVPGCNVVWLNSDVRPAPRAWIAVVVDQPILTMSNYADFTADGGILGAYRVGRDWKFEVNLEALHRSRLSIAAVALRLSQRPPTVAAGDRR